MAQLETENLLVVRNLQKTYGKLKAVDDISFEVRQGEILGILGPNGAGKSTTISMISSLLTPTGGTIYFQGVDIRANPRNLRLAQGVVPQELALYPDLTGRENLDFFGRVYGLRGKELANRIAEVLEITGLREKAGEPVKNYSGGMKRRVNIGVALLHRPRLLIMDEPTVGIDPQSRKYILEMVKSFNQQGMTVIYTSHYMEEVEFLCRRILIMDHGRIIASGTKAELKALCVREGPEETNVKLITPEDVNAKPSNLEEVFLRLTGRELRD